MPRHPELTVALADLEHELAIDQAFDDMACAATVEKPVVLPITRTDAERGVYVLDPTPIECWEDAITTVMPPRPVKRGPPPLVSPAARTRHR